MQNSVDLMVWPWTLAKVASDWVDTMANAGRVIDARTPILAAAFMVSEKANALGRSERSVKAAQSVIRQASEANARALGHVSGGGVLSLAEWTRVFERNLEIAATLASLLAADLLPVQSRAKANARRLVKS